MNMNWIDKKTETVVVTVISATAKTVTCVTRLGVTQTFRLKFFLANMSPLN